MKYYILIVFFLFGLRSKAQDLPAEWDKLGLTLTKLIQENNKDLNYYFDRVAFWERVLIMNPTNDGIKRLNDEILAEIRVDGFDFKRMLDLEEDIYEYKYLYCRPDSVIFIRKWHADEGFNYLGFKVDFIANRWKVVDIYTVMLGNYLSQHIKKTIYVPRVLRLFDSKRSRQYLANSKIYTEAASLSREEELERAYLKISSIPLEERLVEHQQFKINLAIELADEDKLDRSAQEFKERFPNNKSLPIVLLDYYLTNGKYKKALEAIDLIREDIGDDAYMDYEKSLIQSFDQQHKAALENILLAIGKESGNEYYEFQLLEAYLNLRKHKEGVAQLERLRTVYDYNFAFLKLWVKRTYPKTARNCWFKRWAKKSPGSWE